MDKKIELKRLILDYAIYNVERNMTQMAVQASISTPRVERNKQELTRLNTKCEDILRDLTKIIDEL
jgi:hypothetical protein